VGVEGQVVGGKRHLAVEEGLQPCLQLPVDDPRVVFPEQPVMDDQQLRAGLRGPLEQLV
jgi:hypothetical protein